MVTGDDRHGLADLAVTMMIMMMLALAILLPIAFAAWALPIDWHG